MESIFFNPWIWVVPIILGVLVDALILGIRAVKKDDLSVGGPVEGGTPTRRMGNSKQHHRNR